MTGILRLPSSPWAPRALAATLTALLLAAPTTALADERADRTAAQKLVLAGNRATTDADYPQALASFRAAYARALIPKILLDIGNTLRALGRNAEAATSYEAYLRDPRTDRARAADVTRSLAEIDALLGRLRIQVSGGATRVRLDGKALDGFVSGASIRVDPGEHTVIAVREGAAPASATLRIASGEERVLSLVLIVDRPDPVITVARVPPQRTAALVVGGVGAAGLVGAVVAGSVALVDRSHIGGHCFPGTLRCDQAGVDLARASRTLATASTGTFVAGAGLLGAGLVLFFTAPSPPPSRGAAVAVRLAMGASPGGPAAIVEGAW